MIPPTAFTLNRSRWKMYSTLLMWNNPMVRRNVATLTEAGYHLVGPEAGWQACRTVGPGRMSEPEAILDRIINLLGAGQK